MEVRGVESEFTDQDDYIKRDARKMVDSLLRYKIGQGMHKEPRVTAMALGMLNSDLPRDLTHEWAHDYPDIMAELVDEFKEEKREAQSNPFAVDDDGRPLTVNDDAPTEDPF
jgi:hypothetical protein